MPSELSSVAVAVPPVPVPAVTVYAEITAKLAVHVVSSVGVTVVVADVESAGVCDAVQDQPVKL